MAYVTFTGKFDNGRDYYQVDAAVSVDTNKDYLTDSEIAAIVNELQQEDRRQRGRSYRGYVTSIQVADEEFLRQEELGNIVLEDGASDYTYSEGFEWLNTFYASSRDIESCTENEE